MFHSGFFSEEMWGLHIVRKDHGKVSQLKKCWFWMSIVLIPCFVHVENINGIRKHRVFCSFWSQLIFHFTLINTFLWKVYCLFYDDGIKRGRIGRNVLYLFLARLAIVLHYTSVCFGIGLLDFPKKSIWNWNGFEQLLHCGNIYYSSTE